MIYTITPFQFPFGRKPPSMIMQIPPQLEGLSLNTYTVLRPFLSFLFPLFQSNSYCKTWKWKFRWSTFSPDHFSTKTTVLTQRHKEKQTWSTRILTPEVKSYFLQNLKSSSHFFVLVNFKSPLYLYEDSATTTNTLR